MKKITFVLSVVLIVLFIIGCGSNKNLSQVNEGDIPEWYPLPPQDPNFVFAAKTATSQDMQLAVDKAVVDGRAEIGRTIELQLQGLQKKFNEEIGAGENSTLLQQFTQATKIVVDQTLTGSQIKNQKISKDGNLWRAYVLVQYPLGAANEAFMQQIQKQQELYTRYRSSQTFKELEDEVQKYREWKEKQGQN